MNAEQQLRAVLEAEVADFDASPVGWDVIQRRVAGRRRRLVLQRALPTAAGLTGLAVLAAVVVPRLDDGGSRLVPNPPAASEPARTSGGDRLTAVWPFFLESEVADWEREHAAEENYLASGRETVSHFMRSYVGISHLDFEVIPVPRMCPTVNCAEVFEVAKPNGRPMARVVVQDVGSGEEKGPYVVLNALVTQGDPPEVILDAHPPATTGDLAVRTVASLTGTFADADLAAEAQTAVRVTLHGQHGEHLGVVERATLKDDTWSADLRIPEGKSATSVLVEVLDEDGATAQFAATPLELSVPGTAPPPTPSTAPSDGAGAAAPPEFFAVHDGVVGLFRTVDGSLIRTVSETKPGAPYDPYVLPDGRTVYFAQAAGTCAASVDGNNSTGGPAKEMIAADVGAISAPAWPGFGPFAFAVARCQQGGDRVDLVLRELSPIKDTVIDSATGEGAGFRSPTWNHDGTRLAVVIGDGTRPGGSAEIRIYEPGSTQVAKMLPREGCGFTAASWQRTAGGQRLLTAQYCETGGGYQARVYVTYSDEAGGGAVDGAPLLTRGEVPITTLDVDHSGRHVLASESIRNRGVEVWRWDFDGAPMGIPVPPDLQFPAW